ncbi:bacterio-opsin activator domain-containing protein [Haloterrigena alkaliphila]|uniref:bacterio-opsin activator domain-containing protein n=1 Tax=Haloterrigena alkaliphila TaxID=2816475 RepID=UPI001CFFE93D|nr:bacterio-opsin activator domain-containing protein [Haloterrigena alkaliphila]UHQ95300.1 helix-turn-helix domain-containing protein [Haloterrigena alkaliphila]
MSHENRSGSILHVATAHPTALQTQLSAVTSVDVRSVTATSFAESLESVAESDPRGDPDAADDDPAAIVLELDRPERVRDLLERVRAVHPSVPTVVAPSAGNEALATAALRGNADEYVPSDADEDPVDRILSTIRACREPDDSRDSRRARVVTDESTADAVTATTQPSVASGDGTHRILANELPDEAFVIGADGTYLEAKVRPEAAELYSSPPDELPGSRLEDVFPDDVAPKLHDCLDRTLRTGEVQSIEYEAETTGGVRRFEGRVVPIDERIDGQRAVVWFARDITERVRRERELRSRRDHLETLNRIGTVVGRVIDTLVEAPSRDAIEREVCEQLVDSGLYCGAWIAERTGDGRLTYRTSAGEAETYLTCADELETGHRCLIERAVETGAVQTETNIPSSETMPEPLRAAAREDGVRSAIAVPISHNESVYGVLTVLAGRKDAFSDGERAGFGLLGETIGFTIMAVKNRQLLFSDTVVELEFRIDGGDTFSFDLSERYDCTVSLEWAGTTSNGRTVQYVTVDGLDRKTVLEEADAHPSVEECRGIHGSEDGCTIEIRLSESGVRTLANHGATIRDVTVADGVGTCLIEVSQNANVREIAEALTVVYENTELVARREVDRPVRTAAERRDRIIDELTDRQLTTLRLAYYSGFFDWPRESTGEEIADAMDVSPPTMHQHLRKGLKAILAEFFEAGGGTEAD